MLNLLALVLVIACGSCMEMRETVERMVMVRTTGSDLQPAATGYIYKKKNDGPESVVEMGESEVMEHLAKLYEQPKAFAAPIPATKGRLHIKEEDEGNAESKSEERVIPVQEKHEDHIDGIADDDYKKLFDEYTAHYGDNTAYDDYIRKIGLYDDHYKNDAKQDHDGYKGYKNNQFGNGDAGNYHNEKFESYAYKKENDGIKDHENNYERYNKDDVNDGKKAGQNDEEKGYEFHKIFNKNGHKVYGDDGIKVGFHDFRNEPKYQGADSEEQNDSSEHYGKEAQKSNYDTSRHHDESGETNGAHSGDHIRDTHHGDHAAESRPAGQSYSIEIKH